MEPDLENLVAQVRARHASVMETIAASALRAGRDPGQVSVVAVTKGFGPEACLAAAAAGIEAIGENRVQEARDKKPLVLAQLAREPAHAAPIWRLIGHLQGNKVRAALAIFDWFDAVDSLALAMDLSRRAAAEGRRVPVLVEVKVAPEASKHGIAPADAHELVPRIAALPGLDIQGLMTVAPLHAPARPAFRTLAALRDRLVSEGGVALPHLSMGMSSDFAEAVEEGATLIRLGTALFGPRPATGRGAA